ncbi:hypothetical protein P9578_03830 [Brevibacillus choshinensis]|uniref:hypothetical protein n=1 Tax=Brevibacillus choshinensis TaxID=54911 RepID=UPI002E24CEA2|nr:hypothetical protein [Brevibacillus choshinensis]
MDQLKIFKAFLISILLTLFFPLAVSAANVGDVASSVEPGWTRFDLTYPDDTIVQYEGYWKIDTTGGAGYLGKTNGTSIGLSANNVVSKITFDITGSKLMIRSFFHRGEYNLNIDGVDYGTIKSPALGTLSYGVTYINEALDNKRHRVIISSIIGKELFIDSIDIDANGQVISPNAPDPEPQPEPDPDPQPEPSNNNALLVIKMISGLEKEFDLSASEVVDFIDWYNTRADGNGKETYMFEKDFNMGPFTARKDYVAFSKIQSFEVMEYSK